MQLTVPWRVLVPVQLVVAFLLSSASIAFGAETCSSKSTSLTSFGRAMPLGMPVQTSPSMSKVVLDDGATGGLRYARLLVDVKAQASIVWRLLVRDHELRPIAVLRGKGNNSARWTDRLNLNDGNLVYVEISSGPGASAVVIEANVMHKTVVDGYYSLRKDGQPDYVDLYSSDSSKRRLGDHVGMLMGHLGKTTWCCSAFAIGPNHVMTNWHCGGDEDIIGAESVWNGEICKRTIIDFSWDGDATDREFACSKVVYLDKNLDIAVLEVRDLAEGGGTLVPVTFRSSSPYVGENLHLVHHPACSPKKLSFGCSVREVGRRGWANQLPSDFAYSCDTESGSSGAPVFDDEGRVVGIHHLGYQKVLMGGCDGLNKGVEAAALLQRVPEQIRMMVQGRVQ